MLVGIGAGSTEVEGSSGTLVEGSAWMLVVYFAVNIGAVASRLTVTGTRTVTTTTDLTCSLALLKIL